MSSWIIVLNACVFVAVVSIAQERSIKRHLARMEEMREEAMRRWRESLEVDELLDALRDIDRILGPEACGCDGCIYEINDALEIVHRYVPNSYKLEREEAEKNA